MQFLEENQANLKTMDKQHLGNHLCDFYAALRKEDGSHLTTSSLTTIRYSLARFLKDELTMDIIKDPDFLRANEVFSGKQAFLKKNGKGSTKHHSVISDEDLRKIANLSTETPECLQMKVWFLIQYHFARRGAENVHGMKKDDLILEENAKNETEVRLRDFMTKNHREMDVQNATDAVIVAMNGPECPVAMIRKYLSLLTGENPYLWQRPNKIFAGSGAKWYYNAKIGENEMAKMMTNISLKCGLDDRYTNHCVRATAITILGRSFQDNDICAVSGHKSLVALGIYKRTSKATLLSMSTSLHQSMYGASSTTILEPVKPVDDPPALEIDAMEPALEPSHNECRLSYGAHGVPSADEWSHEDWNNLMKACEEAEKQEKLPQCNTINQQAVKKGEKVIILNNCSNCSISFNL